MKAKHLFLVMAFAIVFTGFNANGQTKRVYYYITFHMANYPYNNGEYKAVEKEYTLVGYCRVSHIDIEDQGGSYDNSRYVDMLVRADFRDNFSSRIKQETDAIPDPPYTFIFQFDTRDECNAALNKDVGDMLKRDNWNVLAISNYEYQYQGGELKYIWSRGYPWTEQKSSSSTTKKTTEKEDNNQWKYQECNKIRNKLQNGDDVSNSDYNFYCSNCVPLGYPKIDLKTAEFTKNSKQLASAVADVASVSTESHYERGKTAAFILGWSPSTNALFGLNIGMIKNKGLGWYAATRVTRFGFLDPEYEPDWQYNRFYETKEFNFDLTGGITYKIVFPLAVYAGVGFSYAFNYSIYQSEYSHALDYTLDSYTDFDAWKEPNKVNPDENFPNPSTEGKINPLLDCGLILYFSGFYVAGGIRTNFYSNTYFTFGVGMAIPNP
ncbi:MAG: hypothetical protein LBO06_01970 [Bacteroidales bacterium]|jgi:hypothetical protein|nr:hypothetical protein [Bacteroidales bacterium]